MIFNMGLEDICDVGLGLGLGLRLGNNQVIKVIDGSDSSPPSKKPCFGFETLVPSASTSSELSLALVLSDEAAGHVKPCMNTKCEESVIVNRPASPHSTVSSFSNTRVARKRVFVNEEIDFDRVSSRISDEDEESNVRKKLRLTKEQSALLEDSFKEHTTLNPKQKQALAKQLNLRPRQVEVWFQNRRARTKLKQTEVDCEFLKKCCETLTEENRRLHKELQDLKALKLAPSPLYMKLPAATLTMCPSCKRINGGGVDSKESFAVTPKSQLYNPFTHPSAAC